MKLRHLIGITLLSGLLSCGESGKKEAASADATRTTADILRAHIDTTVKPGDDFFQYANGTWIKNNPIPPSESGWGIFNLVADENYAQLKRISEEASATNSPQGSAQQQIGDFFYCGMDSASIEKQGITPLNDLLQKINQVKTTNDLIQTIAQLQVIGVQALYAFDIEQDMKHSDKNMVYLSQGGLGLPDRDYYFNTDANTKNIRQEYLAHIRNVLMLLDPDSAKAGRNSAAIMKLETEMAKSHKKLEDLRDPYANYHKMSLDQLDKLTPAMNWKKSLADLNVVADSVIVGQPAFFTRVQSLLQGTGIETWKTYLTWQLLETYSPYLSSAFDDEAFHFRNVILNGSTERRPRWKRVLDAQEAALGDAMGQLFVKEYFPEKTKKRYEDLVEQVIISFRKHIEQLDWMSDSTKQKALKKLNAITRKVGYPSKWKDYSQMKIGKESFAKNIMEANRWRFNYEADKLKKPVDRSEWSMTPQTYNAYYNASNNEIVLPAAIFTAPGYKDDEIDDAVIYGYVGASTIGHELTHGFDDQGRQFDELGNLTNWWSKEDEAKFKTKANLLVEQFNQFVVLDSLHPNGKATLGENIADLGGIVIALDAFKQTAQFKENKPIEGLTPLQRYFLGYAYGWMQVRTPKRLASQLLTDVHAPIFLRVNGPMSNCDEWYQAFNVTPGQKLYRDPQTRVKIW